MDITQSRKMPLDANAATPTKCLRVPKGTHRVDIEYGAGVTATITPRQSATTDAAGLHACKIGADAIVLTGTDSFLIVGPCYLAFIVASLSGGIASATLNSAE